MEIGDRPRGAQSVPMRRRSVNMVAPIVYAIMASMAAATTTSAEGYWILMYEYTYAKRDGVVIVLLDAGERTNLFHAGILWRFFFNLDIFLIIFWEINPVNFFLNLTLLHYVSLSDVTYKKIVLVHMVRLGSTMSPPLPLGWVTPRESRHDSHHIE
jgi:hypothetical protein